MKNIKKNTRTIIALSVLGLALVSCKKEANKEIVGTETTTQTDSLASVNSQEPVVGAHSEASHAATETPAKSNAPLTTIVLAQSNYDFGDIKKGDKVQHDYEITNTGTNPLIISEVKPGCGCTAPDYTKEPIMPGKKGKITLSFDSSSFENNVEKFADVYANVEKAPIKLTFTANVKP